MKEFKVEVRWRVKEIKELPILQLRGETSNTELPAKDVESVLISNAVAISMKAREYDGILIQMENIYGKPTEMFNCEFSVLFKKRRRLLAFLRNF